VLGTKIGQEEERKRCKEAKEEEAKGIWTHPRPDNLPQPKSRVRNPLTYNCNTARHWELIAAQSVGIYSCAQCSNHTGGPHGQNRVLKRSFVESALAINAPHEMLWTLKLALILQPRPCTAHHFPFLQTTSSLFDNNNHICNLIELLV
jgi:hypothetical protein